MLSNKKMLKLIIIVSILIVLYHENSFFDKLVSSKVNVALSLLLVNYLYIYDKTVSLLFTILFLTLFIKHEYHQNSLFANH